ncbi:hypothetical protein DITRI_Ditri11bG0047400 [Diplodiscus trichospermus]
MELQHLFYFPFFFTILLVLFMVMKQYRKHSKACNVKKQRLPPGPWKLPLIGNLHQMFGLHPHRQLRDLAKKCGPFMHLQLGEVSALVVSSPEAAKEVMKKHDLVFSQRPQLAAKIMSYACKSIRFCPYGCFWRQLRKICILELLSAKRVEEFGSIREEEVKNMIESIALSGGQPVNLSQKLSSLSYHITARAAFGSKCKDQEEFISAIKETLDLAGGFNVPDIFPSLKFLRHFSGVKPALESIHQKIDKILNNIINEHKQKRQTTKSAGNVKIEEEDLVDVLLNLQECGDLHFPLTVENIKAVILDMFTAGTDTSSTTTEWAMSELIKKTLQCWIRHRPKLHPPAPLLLPREARERCEVNRYEIPVKTRVIVNAWAIGRDPEYWNNPDCFEPARFHNSSIDFKGANFEFIPFGAGRRMCPGISYGIANMELPLALLLYHFDWKLPNGLRPEQLDMRESFGVSVRRKNGLHLIATPYVPIAKVVEGSTKEFPGVQPGNQNVG